MTQEPRRDTAATRRGVLAGAGLVGLAGALSACASGGSNSSSSSAAAPAGTPTSSSAPAATTPAAGGGQGGKVLAAKSEIPVGGGKIFDAEKVVVTQPTAGEFKGFSAVCTHMGCIVNQITGGTIDCPCHGSQYSITNGAVVGGPAPSPLPAVAISDSGSSISLG